MTSFDFNCVASSLILRFKCSNCDDEVESDDIFVPQPDYTSDTAHDSTSSDSEEVYCSSCGAEYNVNIYNSYAGGSGDIDDDVENLEVEEYFPEEDNDDYYSDLFTDISESIAFTTANDSLNKIIALLPSVPVDVNLKTTFYNLLYSNAIAIFEAYLSDTLISTTLSKESYLRKFVETFKDYQTVSFCLNDLFEKKDNITDIVKRSLQDIIYHNIAKVSGIYQDTLNITFPQCKEIYKAVVFRHDIVHRNGKTKDGDIVQMNENSVQEIVEKIREFIENINTQMKGLF